MVVDAGRRREKEKLSNDIGCLCVIGGMVDVLSCEQRISCR